MNFSYKDLIKQKRRGGVLSKSNVSYDQAFQNKQAWYLFYREYFSSLIVSLFEWKNLPEGIDPIFLEKSLNMHGYVGFLFDEEKGFIIQNGTLTDNLDLYDRPLGFQVVSPVSHLLSKTNYYLNNYYDDLDPEKAFLIENDLFRNSSFYWVDLYASKLSEIEQSIELTRNALKTPFIILTDEENKLSVKNFYQQVEEGRPAIYIKNNKNKDGVETDTLLDKLQVLNTNVPSHLLKDLYEEKVRVFNQFLNFIGITSNNNDKKERLVADEVNADDGLIATSLENKLKARRKSIDLINKCFGLNIEVNISSSIEMHNIQMYDEELDLLNNSLDQLDFLDGGSDGKIHNDN